jgi:hypothetical protein
MAESLKTILEKITAELKTSTGLGSYYFGSSGETSEEDAESRFLDEIFSDHLKKFSGDFGKFGLEIDSIRSTVLPASTVNAIAKETASFDGTPGLKSDETSGSDTKIRYYEEHLLESYENAFLRMMGMPSEKNLVGKNVLTLEDSKIKIKKDGDSFSFLETFNKRSTSSLNRVASKRSESVLFLSESQRAIKYLSEEQKKDLKLASKEASEAFEEEKKENGELGDNHFKKIFFLKVAEKDSFSQFVSDPSDGGIDSYDSEENSGENNIRVFGSPLDEDLSTYFKYQVLKEAGQSPSLINYHEYILREASLLFPPVQDSSVEYCLSEPSKMVSKPFDFGRVTVNRQSMKVSLLESVLRIRLDVVTGYKQKGDRKGKKNLEGIEIGGVAISDPSENNLAFSIIEKIIINRLNLALDNFADAFYELTENYFKVCKKARTTIKEMISVEDQISTTKLTSLDSSTVDYTDEERKLNLLKEIDDTILILLEKNKEISREFGSFRTTNVNDSVSMNTLIKLITVPSSYAKGKIKKFDKNKKNSANGVNGVFDTSAKLAQMMGLKRGVGILDLICFSLGFFTSNIEDIIGLLDKQQQKKLKSEYEGKIKFDIPEMDEALIRVSSRIIEAYNLFSESLKD